MTTHYTDATVTLHHGDCLDVLRSLPDCSVDSVVTDPPYGLGFMGKAWDDLPPGLPFAVECLRVLKPGGHLLAFGGTRTWHRLACAVEDAGFEIRDSIAWMYGSGFPKSLDVSKAIDKAAGAERGTNPDLRNGPNTNAATKGDKYSLGFIQTAPLDLGPATPDAERWQGWGTALKPAFEPVVVARKPLSGTVAANVLAHGTGALNVDGCRVEGEPRKAHTATGLGSVKFFTEGDNPEIEKSPHASGRWPANVILDESQAGALDAMSGELASQKTRTDPAAPSADTDSHLGTLHRNGRSAEFLGETGGASRFFYVAKADQSERVRVDGIAHPTVKPLALMRWLVRLVTPPGGTVLEPFAGSGTTVEACILEGFKCVAIEREADYLPLIVQRINRRRDPVAAVMASGDDDLGLFDLLDGGAA